MKLIERNQIFKQHKYISSLIKGFQKSFFDEEFDKVDDEMFDAILLETEKNKNSEFNIMLNHLDINSYPKVLTEKLKDLLNFLKTENLILISHLKLESSFK